jgi:predicted membrane channel-forming protein YqfA (hemolysin III family)
VSMLPIAQLPSAMYTPVLLLIIAYAVLSILANRARSNDDRPRTERFSNWAFLVVLVFALYAVVLLIASVVSYPSRFYDMVLIIFVIAVFFALLLSAFFVIAEVIPNVLRRSRDR